MNKFIKKNCLLFILSGGLILTCCDQKIPPVTEEDKIVESVIYDLNSYNLDFLNTDTIDFTQAKLKATFTDGSEKLCDITTDMFDESLITKELGEHPLTFSVSFVNGYSCKVSVEYFIHNDQNRLDFSKYSRFVPYENELTQDDIDNVITAIEYKEKIGQIDNNDPLYPFYLKVSNSEKAIVDIYKDAKKEEFLTLFEGMYPNLYTSIDYLACKSAVTSFTNRSYVSPKEIKNYYDDTLKVLQNVSKKDMDLDSYKIITIDGLKERFITVFTELKAEGEKGSQTFFFKEKEKNFYPDLSFSLTPYFEKIVSAKTKAEVDNINNEAFLGCFTEFKEVYAGEIQTSFITLANMFSKMDYNVNQAWKEWCAADPDNRDEFAVSPKATNGSVVFDIVSNVSVEYLPPDDGRQFNIEPYRMSTLSEKAPDLIMDATSVMQAQVLYDKLFFEFVQSACEKCIEMHYYFKQAMNYDWDKTMVIYWAYIGSYNGDVPEKAFTYTGVLKEYYGRKYGYSGAVGVAFRLCPWIYGPSSPNTIEGLLANLVDLLFNLVV